MFGLFKRVKKCEKRLDSIGPLVKDFNTKALMQIEDAVSMKVITLTDRIWGKSKRESIENFAKGTEPKCDFIMIEDGVVKYCKTIPGTFVEVKRDGSPLKAKKKK